MRCVQVAVIGAGPAGCAAAVQCKRLGLTPVLFDKSGRAGGLIANAFSIENYPGFLAPVSGREFASLLQVYISRFDIQVERCDVCSINSSDGQFVLETNDEPIIAKAVIIATGTAPCGVNALSPISPSRIFTDLVSMPRPYPSNVLVVGGGEAAFDYSLSLVAGGSRVTLAHRSSQPRCTGVLRNRVEHESDIRILAGCSPVAAIPRDNCAKVVLSCGASDGAEQITIECDAVLTAVGRCSALAALTASLGELVLTGFCTNLPGLYVAGDARLGTLGQAAAAVGDGLLCAMAAAAEHVAPKTGE